MEKIVCCTTQCHLFIHCSCCSSFSFAYLFKPKPGGNQLTPSKPRMNNQSQAKTWMKPRYLTKQKGKWSLPWPTSALLSLRLDLQIRRQMAFHVWKDGIFAQSTICMKLNATQVHITVVLLGINNFCLTFKCKCGFCWCLNHVQERCSEIYCMVAYNNEASKKD